AVYKQLVQWTAQQDAPVSKWLLAVAYILPGILIASLAAYGILRDELYWTIASRLFPINLFIFFLVVKKVKKAMFSADKVNDMLKEYSAMFRQAEVASYTSEKLQNLQQRLNVTGAKASTEIQKLAAIFAAMETVQNPFSAVIMNGLYLHHIHQLHKLNNWKQQYAAHVPGWLEVLGELEMLGSLANLHDNNPEFCFPSLNADHVIAFSGLGHPLIAAEKRVCNDVTFDEHRFIILTGSNMSGKSTFLRTLGINLVLARSGSVVCAQSFRFFPFELYVSMRITDSLQESQSFFYAELKRLQTIIQYIQSGHPTFILLDEILRGTNSNDKRNGTIGLITT
ncbi:MAG: DNA mismatch repair protein MutS, partial [Sphingobacteriales bacterium]